MNYHDIKHDDMNNGPGLRVTLFVSGCSHHCKDCQNPETWSTESGIPFDEEAVNEIFEQLDKDYISGITFSGGDPLNENNKLVICDLISQIRKKYGNTKSIWIYTGYVWEQIKKDASIAFIAEANTTLNILKKTDVIVDGMIEKDLADVNYHWAGSTNQRVIDVKKSLEKNKVVLFE